MFVYIGPLLHAFPLPPKFVGSGAAATDVIVTDIIASANRVNSISLLVFIVFYLTP